MSSLAQPYTEEEADLIRTLAGEGQNDTEIETTTGIARRRVRAVRKRFDIAAGQPVHRVLDSDDRGRYVKPMPEADLERLRREVNWFPGMLDGV